MYVLFWFFFFLCILYFLVKIFCFPFPFFFRIMTAATPQRRRDAGRIARNRKDEFIIRIEQWGNKQRYDGDNAALLLASGKIRLHY